MIEEALVSFRGRRRLFDGFVFEFAQISKALSKRAQERVAPSAGTEPESILIDLKICRGKEFQVAGLGGCELLDGDSRFDFAGRVFLCD